MIESSGLLVPAHVVMPSELLIEDVALTNYYGPQRGFHSFKTETFCHLTSLGAKKARAFKLQIKEARSSAYHLHVYYFLLATQLTCC